MEYQKLHDRTMVLGDAAIVQDPRLDPQYKTEEASLASSIDGSRRFDDLQERDKPPLRPPRPNRTLGGINLRADIVDARLSTSTSADEP